MSAPSHKYNNSYQIRIIAILIFVFSFQLFGSYSYSQEAVKLNPQKALSQYPVKTWDMDKGMPSDMVIKILQDSTGYIWLATYKGIARFDGVTFKLFNQNNTPVIESVTIQDATIDNLNQLWFGSQKGIVKYCNNEFSRDSNLNQLNLVSVEALYFHKQTKSLWIGTTSEGVYRFSNGILEHMTDFLDITRGVVKTIGSDINSNIWIGTEGGRVIMYDGNSFNLIQSRERMGGIGSFYCSCNNGSFWIAAETGVFKLINGQFEKQTYLPTGKANVLIEDNFNTLWVGTDLGIYRYHLNTGILDKLDEQKGIPNNLIRDLLPDKDGNLWVATYRRGLFKLTDGLITNISENEGLSSDLITAVTQIDRNKFLVADEQGAINIIDNGRIERFKLKNKITMGRLKHLFFDSKKNIWVSTYGGLIKVEPNGKETILNYSTKFPSDNIRSVFEDKSGVIWVGTRSNGLIKINKNGSFEEFNIDNGFASNYVMAINQDLKGRILVATKNGLHIIVNGKVDKIIDMQSGLPSGFAFNIHIDEKNVVWLSSNDGIIRIENDVNFFVYNIQNGLFDNTLFDILEDDFGFFWMPTDIGIVRISKDELNQFAQGKISKYSYTIFGRSDGLKNPRCTGATKSFKSWDGRLFFSTSGGIAYLNPKDIIDDNFDSKVVFESLVVDEKELQISKSYKVSPDHNRINFSYSAFYYSDPEKIRFRYRLEPFDKVWVDAGSERVARYTNIPSGDYTFSIQASINPNSWTGETYTIDVAISNYWWDTVWFRVSFAFLLALVLWAIYKVRTYTVKKQKMELERLVEVRTAVIAQQKLELEQQSMELEKLSIVASHTNNAILITSPEAEIQWVNESFTRIYGYTLDEFIAERGSNLAHLSNNSNAQYIINKCIKDKEPLNYTSEITTKNGATVWIQTSLTPVRNTDGTLRAIVVIDSDITDLKMVENEMITMNDEIIQQADAILQQKEAIQSHRDDLEQVNNLLIRHTQNIEASIWYAHTIQKAILPTNELIDSFFENFIVFKPRDIVSGDFYWFTSLPGDKSKRCIIAVVDCTGHGVPGALMSMIGSRLLSEIISDRKVYDPARILFQLNKLVNIVLKQDSVENIDGMDVALCLIEKNGSKKVNLTFSGANRPLYLLKKGEQSIQVIKGNRKTIGGIMPDIDAEFKNHKIVLTIGDMVFLSSDGYIDQNRKDGKKISTARLQQMIVDKSELSMKELGEFLDVSFDEFRGTEQQRDDVAVIGLRF